MTAWMQIGLGLLIGWAGFHGLGENPFQGSCALFIAGFLFMSGFEKRLAGKHGEPVIESDHESAGSGC